MMKFKKYINFFISLVLLPILVVLRFIFSFSRRVNNIWIFSSWNGLTFSDNAKYLFIYTNKNLHEIKSF